MAVFSLQIATDNHHPHITHAPWEAARTMSSEEPKLLSQELAYNAYA